jgi:hypothetical protein
MVQSLIEKLNTMSIKPTNHASSLIQDVEQRIWEDNESEVVLESDLEKDLLNL